MSGKILAVVLCAGEGSRIRDQYKDMPKPLIPIENSSILETLLNSLYQQGVKKVALIKGHLGHKIDEFAIEFRRFHNLSSSELIVIDSGEDYKLGPLHSFLSISKNAAVFKEDQSYIVIPGDVVFDLNLLCEIGEKVHKKGSDTPIIFYREVNINTLNKEVISVAHFNSINQLTMIVQANLKEFSGNPRIKQIIPFFFSPFTYIQNILQFDRVKSFETLREAINISIDKGFRVTTMKVESQKAFYDIDNQSDLEEYIRSSKKRQ